jgi:ABC-type multidrug transport system fused ATPase/permease subunit
VCREGEGRTGTSEIDHETTGDTAAAEPVDTDEHDVAKPKGKGNTQGQKEGSPAQIEAPTALRWVLQFVDGVLLAAGCLLTLCSVVVGVMVPTRSAALLKAAQQGRLTAKLVVYVLALVNAQALLKVAGSYCLLLAGQKVKRKLRELLFSSVLAQDLAWVASSRPAALIAQLATDTEELARSISASLGMAITSAATVLGAVVQLAVISPQLTLLVLLIAPPIATVASFASRYDRRLRKRANEASSAATMSAGESFTKLPTIQAYAQESREAARYSGLLEKEGALQRTHLTFHKAWTSMLQVVTNMTTAVALAYAGALAARGALDPSLLLSFSQLSMSLSHGVGQFLFLAGDAAKLSDAAERIKAVAERTPGIPPGGATLDRASPFLRGEVVFDNVRFSYPSRSEGGTPPPPVLDGLNLTLRAGKVTALVGPSGGGKTTAAHLVARFLDADDSGDGGRVLLDGADLKTLSPTWLRTEVVGLVTQEPVLLPGTVAENIAYGRPSASHAEVGYQTELLEGGGLSVGQRQRIAIARALLKDPKVLVLDEPTSALDSESEKVVQQALDRLAHGRTTLVVAHRLSTIRNADSIAVLHGGRVTECGTHDELLREDGEYASMVKASERYESIRRHGSWAPKIVASSGGSEGGPPELGKHGGK